MIITLPSPHDYLLFNINNVMGLNAPYYALSQVAPKDSYIDKDGDGWAPGPNYSASGMTQLLFLFRDPDDTNPAVQPVLPPDVWNMISNILLDEVTNVSAMNAEANRLGIK